MDKITLGDLFSILQHSDCRSDELTIFGSRYKVITKMKCVAGVPAIIDNVFINQFKISFRKPYWTWTEVRIIDLDQFPRKTIFYGSQSKETVNTTLKSIIGVSPVKSARN
jgi:hypothetical protein